MSYEYTHTSGSRLLIQVSTYPERTFIKVREEPMHIPNADVPTVAAELLKAAGVEATILPKAYEGVEQLGDEITCGSGPEKAYGSMSQNPNWLWNKAANYLALAEYIESKAAREADAEKKLQKRRDAVAAECAAGVFDAGVTYDACPDPLRVAIDRIIELDYKLKATP